MQRFFPAVLPGLAAALFLALPAQAQAQAAGPPNCAARAAVVEQLASRYGESRRAIGIAANNAVMELFASAETGSWTLTVTLPSGLTCLLASGESFEALAEPLPASGKRI